MTENELDTTVIKRTQDKLGKFVKKPPLTEKLLKKPPFRFLYDVFKVVIKDTGCFEGLYTADELNFENIKDRDDKMVFLQKMIDVVKLTTQKELNVRTSKIVAGHEPERTNELLQLMGEIIEKEMDWQKAVKAVLATDGSTLTNGTLKNETKKEEKTLDKPKGKTNSKTSKEVKTKEGQSKKSTPSPDDKTAKKTIKMTPKEKEKLLSRQGTVEKVTKEKEKTIKKSKDATPAKGKIKDERKRTTPSPLKPVTKITQHANKMKTENLDTKIEKEVNLKTHQENVNTKIENEVKYDKPKESIRKQLSTENLNETQAVGELEPENNKSTLENHINGEAHETNSRKTSPSEARKSSSTGKSRRSSASKQKPIATEPALGNVNQNPLESLQSVKTTNEVETQGVVKSLESQETAPTSAQLSKPAKEFKRQPTFTHENSRESVGSNSNSSNTRPRTSLRPPSARPASARPGAPRRRDKNVEIILQPNDQVKISNINVKLESFGDLDDDGENLVIIEDAATSTSNFLNDSSNTSKLEAEKLEQQGHLVQQILETQKELVQENGEMSLKAAKDNLESSFDAKARQSSARQMNNLRDIIQNLTKSVNPFGKLMEFIPEDIDAMQLEFNMWRDAYSQAASDLKREKSLTESATEPMKNQLIQIDANIKEYLEMIDASRVKILQNSDKILKMLLEQ